MAQPNLNTRLTSMDASFLYFEKKESPMHIGSVSIFEGEIPFDKFMENINSKMHLLPRYQQKVIPDPFNLGHPTWEFDSEFRHQKSRLPNSNRCARHRRRVDRARGAHLYADDGSQQAALGHLSGVRAGRQAHGDDRARASLHGGRRFGS